MKKEMKGFVFMLVLVLIISLTVVSAGWFGDAWNKITGDVASSTTDIGEVIKQETKIEIFCNETDNGQDYFIMGITTNVDESKKDFCSGGESILSLHPNLTEYYCYEGEEIAEEIVVCEFGCLFGACLETELPEDSCLDTDKINDPFIFGSVYKIGEAHVDKCIDSKNLIQYYCSGGGGINNLTTICGSGCNLGEGVCFKGSANTTTSECYDSDSLNDIYVFGSVIIPGQSVDSDKCVPSLNNAPIAVKQYSCNSLGEVESSISNCGEDCKDENGNRIECSCFAGECESPPVVYECVDSDGGENYLEKGIITRDSGVTTFEDYCEDATGLWEYACYDNEIKSYKMHCGHVDVQGVYHLELVSPMHYCQEGKCIVGEGDGSSGGVGKDSSSQERIQKQTFFQKVGGFFSKIFSRNSNQKVNAINCEKGKDMGDGKCQTGYIVGEVCEVVSCRSKMIVG